MDNKYLIDTSTIIDIGQRYYPNDIFPDLWTYIYNLIDTGLLCITDGVIDEIKDKVTVTEESNIGNWRNKLIESINNSSIIKHGDYQKEYAQISNKCYSDSLYRGNTQDAKVSRFLDKADLWLISVAKKDGFTVITQETPGKLKIPSVCQLEGVKCINVIELFRTLGINFVTKS